MSLPKVSRHLVWRRLVLLLLAYRRTLACLPGFRPLYRQVFLASTRSILWERWGLLTYPQGVYLLRYSVPVQLDNRRWPSKPGTISLLNLRLLAHPIHNDGLEPRFRRSSSSCPRYLHQPQQSWPIFLNGSSPQLDRYQAIERARS